MNIADLGKKYNLDSSIDLWKCHNNWILTHDAITKIALTENIKISRIESIYQSETSCRFLVTMVQEDGNGVVVNSITSIGEADNGTDVQVYLNTGNSSRDASYSNADAAGQGKFAYSVPSGYFALCTKNIETYG